ncbi:MULTISPECIES: hypothetical protein [Nocardiaceae]|uniref:hypothetical protein n=1 Tax=Nocardiaceae TaxID=85025 RepID=UPI000ACA5223|nr:MULTISPECIES: hypothetical protein [Rhodococcus]MDJ0408912.1 hypothetical protein [Rhodococcus fascians]
MASPNTLLRNWLNDLQVLRREFDSYDERLEEWTDPGSVERSRAGVKQRLAFQMGIFMRLVVASGVPSPTDASGVLGYSHFLRVVRLIADDASMEKAVASYRSLNDQMITVGRRWVRSGVDVEELAGLQEDLKAEADLVRELGGDPEVPEQWQGSASGVRW